MPVIGHKTISADAHRATRQRLLDAPLEGFIVGLLAKEIHPPHASIANVKNHPARRYACCSRHFRFVVELFLAVDIKPVPFIDSN